MTKTIYVNLPVADLAVATRFYEAIGCARNEQFSDERAASMVWSDAITFQLLTRDYFASFAPRPVANTHEGCQVLLALTSGSREEVDAVAEAAGASGGRADVRERMDLGWMYNRAFEDPDGHVYEAVWMDMAAMPAGPGGS